MDKVDLRDLPPVLTIEEVAKVMRISRGSAYESVRAGGIPSIRIDATVVGVGLLADGSMDVPANLWTLAWLSSGALPGKAGSTVIAGHRGIGTPAVFSRLEAVRPGQRIYVSDTTGSELVYEVTSVVALGLSPSSQVAVFGPTASQQLVLITCFGSYSSITGTYDHRLVVFSRLVPPNSG